MFRPFRDFLFRRVLWEVRQQAHFTRIALLALEKRLMTKFDELGAALDDIKTGLADHSTQLTEIGGDIDDLIALVQNAGIPDAALQPLLDKANEIKASVAAESDSLNALAAKHDTPPAEPEPGA
jgi:ABC-type transporter Mla subunit MlaD